MGKVTGHERGRTPGRVVDVNTSGERGDGEGHVVNAGTLEESWRTRGGVRERVGGRFDKRGRTRGFPPKSSHVVNVRTQEEEWWSVGRLLSHGWPAAASVRTRD